MRCHLGELFWFCLASGQWRAERARARARRGEAKGHCGQVCAGLCVGVGVGSADVCPRGIVCAAGAACAERVLFVGPAAGLCGWAGRVSRWEGCRRSCGCGVRAAAISVRVLEVLCVLRRTGVVVCGCGCPHWTWVWWMGGDVCMQLSCSRMRIGASYIMCVQETGVGVTLDSWDTAG